MRNIVSWANTWVRYSPVSGRKNNVPSTLHIHLAGLIITLTWHRLARENITELLHMYIRGFHTTGGTKNTLNSWAYVPFWTKEREVGVWAFTVREAGNSQGDEKEQTFRKQIFVWPPRNNGTQWGVSLTNRLCLASPCLPPLGLITLRW